MSQPPPRVGLAGVVLCGGQSRRMGTDKAGLRLAGATLLERAVVRLRPACDPVFIAPGVRPLEVAGCATVADAGPSMGPLGGLLAALRASPHPALAVVAVDMPWIDARLLRLLASCCQGPDAAVPLSDRGAEPLHAVYSRDAIAVCEAAAAAGEHSLTRLLGRMQVAYVTPEELQAAGIDAGFARNLNSPADLEDIRGPLGQEACSRMGRRST